MSIYTLEKHLTFENFEVRCPHCLKWNIYNRASDLKTFRPISGMNVLCQHTDCAKEFRIGGDLINPALQMMLIDCERLKEQKRYTYCILNLTQAFEIYFALLLRVELIFRPYDSENFQELKLRNQLARLLFEKTFNWTYFRLRNSFMTMLVKQHKFGSLAESEVFINSLSSFAKTAPSDEAISAIQNQKLSATLLKLKKCQVSSLRNNVVHKNAYRPTLDEVENAMEESAEILYSLEHSLQLSNEKALLYEVI